MSRSRSWRRRSRSPGDEFISLLAAAVECVRNTAANLGCGEHFSTPDRPTADVKQDGQVEITGDLELSMKIEPGGRRSRAGKSRPISPTATGGFAAFLGRKASPQGKTATSSPSR